MKSRSRLAFALLIAAAIGLSGVSCAVDKTKNAVIVASMIDSEGALLGKMIVALLESKKIPVVDKTEFGTPDVLRRALEAGEVHLVVDYTGSGQYYHEGQDSAIWSDPKAGYEKTKELDAKKGIVWLTPAPANNTEALAVKKEFAEKTGIKDLPGLAAYINQGGAVKLICAQSFADNPLGLLGLEAAYGFKLDKSQLVLLSSGNTAEMLKALSEGTNGINVSLVYGTDGALDNLNLLVLEDPKSIPPVYLPAPVVLETKLKKYPKIAETLAPVFESLDLQTLQKLNAQIAFGGKAAADVAKEYLREKGFLGK
ncbi:MAG: glycine betaine ABC transporter substrate-binding protein [Spirochaetota bacterium]